MWYSPFWPSFYFYSFISSSFSCFTLDSWWMITDSGFQFIFSPFLFVPLATLISFNFLEKNNFYRCIWILTTYIWKEIRCFISNEINTLIKKIKSLQIKIITYASLLWNITDKNLSYHVVSIFNWAVKQIH